MKRTFLFKTLPLVLLISGLVLTVTFAQTGAGEGKKSIADTVPKKQKQVRNLDDALLDLDKGEVEMDKAMREIDGKKMELEMRAAMKGLDVDMTKMKEDMAKAMKDIDMQKINADVQKSLAGMQKELQQIDVEKMRGEVAKSLASVDMKKMKAELQKVKEMDFSKMKKDLEGIRPEIEKSMREAKKDIANARQELAAYKNLVNALDKDGHLKKEANYKVEYKSGELTVNGKKLSADETRKYNEFLSGMKDFTIQKEEDGMNIRNK
jgi:hypothetical protein